MQPPSGFNQPAKLVTGRVIKNVLAVFGQGSRESLEVRLKLSEAPKRQQPDLQSSVNMDSFQNAPAEQAMTPTASAEWNSFIQSNHHFGQPNHVSRVASPALSQHHQTTGSRRGSFGPCSQVNMSFTEQQQAVPSPVGTPAAMDQPFTAPKPPQGTSRPSSRASTKRPYRPKQPTGRPRGRPRKNANEGNTSGYEDGTEGEDGPAKKRIKTTVVDKVANHAFGTGPESLRISASTSGSLRNFRPVSSNNETAQGSHLQEVPRAPTPIPNGVVGVPGRGPKSSLLRRGSTMTSQDSRLMSTNSAQGSAPLALSPNSQDDRSPESIAPTPAYSVDSPADMGSSPPAPIPSRYMRTSPVSSPVLPPMPREFSQEQESMADISTLPEAVLQFPDPDTAKNQSLKGDPEANGDDLMQTQSYNTPQPTSNTIGPGDARLDIQRRVKHKSQIGGDGSEQSKRPIQSHVPTPPPTTDAVEKSASPDLQDCPPETSAKRQNQPYFKPMTVTYVPPPVIPPQARKPRTFARSQSSGPLVRPVPANESAGPSALANATSIEHSESSAPRATSTGPTPVPVPAVPASDPVGPAERSTKFTMHLPAVPATDAACPPSDIVMPSSPQQRPNKNDVKKHSIKARLEEAISKGEMPPYCSNCGAIETPTWRKIWSQHHEGVPAYTEYSGEAGRITAIEITKRDENSEPAAYRLIKKQLGKTENRKDWEEILVCNPCGIWLGKYHEQRPQERWANDFARVNKERKRRTTGNNGRARKSRTKSDAQRMAPLEPNPTTDAPAPVDDDVARQIAGQIAANDAANQLIVLDEDETEKQSNPGTSHSRPDEPSHSLIEADEDATMGTTKRLLFPSPKKDSSPKVLGEVAINIVQTVEDKALKEAVFQKSSLKKSVRLDQTAEIDELEALFRSPARPSTPPPAESRAATFKTPTRPTPSRPVTRSVSRSMRSQRSNATPGQHAQPGTPTPTKASRSGGLTPGSILRRRSPRNHDNDAEVGSETPLTRSINQMLMSDPSAFMPEDNELDFGILGNGHGELLEFGNFLSTDNMMPSSSPTKDGYHKIDFSNSNSFDWSQWEADMQEPAPAEATPLDATPAGETPVEG